MPDLETFPTHRTVRPAGIAKKLGGFEAPFKTRTGGRLASPSAAAAAAQIVVLPPVQRRLTDLSPIAKPANPPRSLHAHPCFDTTSVKVWLRIF